MARSSDSTATPRSTSCSSKWACRLTSLPPSSVRLTLTPFSVHGAASLNLAPCGGDWADLRRVLMKAIRLLEYGGQLVFNDVPTPTIARDEILVKIRSTAVNHLDLVEASGTARQILPINLPWIPGHEFSGIVEQIGSAVAACSQVMPYSVPPPEWARTRSIWLSRRRPSQGNHPISHLRRRHQCRWPPKLHGRDFSPMVIWKRDKRS